MSVLLDTADYWRLQSKRERFNLGSGTQRSATT